MCLQRSNLPVPATTIPESPVVGELDTDKDGMPDSWETKYGLNPTTRPMPPKTAITTVLPTWMSTRRVLIRATQPSRRSFRLQRTGTFDTVKLTFSEDLDPTTATNAANYTISPSLAVTAATYKNKVVTLTTAKQTPGATAYTVTVKGVQDLSKNEVAAGTKATFYSYLLTKTGVLKFSYWGSRDRSRNPVDGLTSDPRYPASPDLLWPVFRLTAAMPSRMTRTRITGRPSKVF